MPEIRATPDSSPETGHAFPLLATKLYVPRARPDLVPRPRLLEQLTQGLSGRLILLSGPAGFGKTTLLCQWLAENKYPAAWLSLDTGDNDAVRFLRYLITAVRTVLPGIGEGISDLLDSPQPLPVEAALTVLINELCTLTNSFVLVLDDYHAIDEATIHSALAFLVDNLPQAMHLVIATRVDPPLPLARWRSRGQMAEIRADDLRFAFEEITEFFGRSMGLDLSSDEIATLEERTEGWIVGLQMAALSMRGRRDVSDFIQSFSGSHRYILDYLVEEILSQQSQEVQTFLLHTSILKRLTAPLCDAVLEQTDSQAILERLEKANLFLVPLDDERCWYRYHHLFADLLRTQLQRSLGAQGIAQLHVRASEWHAHHGSVLEAIDHASMASDDERVERFIEQHYMEMVSHGEQSWIRLWTGKLSKELVYSRPWLCIYEAYSHSWFGELDEADRLLEEAEKRIRSEISGPDAPSMQGLLAYVKSRVTAMRGDIHRAIEFCLEAREHVPDSNLALQLDTLITLGYEYFLNGDYAHASPILNETIRSGIAAGAVINTVAASCLVARLVAVQGLLHRSYDTYQMAAQSIPEASEEHRGARALVEVGLADVFCEWNDLDAALVHLQQGLALLPWWGKADDFALAYITLARIHLAQANRSDALEAVEKAIQIIQTSGVFPEARHAVEIAQVKLWLAQGDLQAADRWAAAQEERWGSNDEFRFEHELTHITRARVWVAQSKPNEAIRLLSHLEKTARSAGRMGRVIEILLLQALAMQEIGNSERAVVALTKSLTLAEPEGYVRIFLDEGPPMGRLLRSGLKHGTWGEFRLVAYANRLLAAFEQGEQRMPESKGSIPMGGHPALIESLSERELEILQLMASGLSNREIAGQLYLATGTVKAHLHNVYGKLDVRGRAQAIVRARELELL
jgi:LuxR family maltose regulon positive regulatory protein